MKNFFDNLDHYFATKGLVPKRLPLGTGTKWQGQLNGRAVAVVSSRRSRTKYYGEDIRRRVYVGHELVIELSTWLKTRLTILPPPGGIARKLDQLVLPRLGVKPIPPPHADFAHLQINTFDENWTASFLADDRVRELLTTVLLPLVTPSVTFGIQPETVTFRIRTHWKNITPERIEQLLAAVQELIELAELKPAPEKVAERTRWEQKIRTQPMKYALLALAGFLGTLFLLPVLLITLIYFKLLKYVLAAAVSYFVWRRFRKNNRPAAENV